MSYYTWKPRRSHETMQCAALFASDIDTHSDVHQNILFKYSKFQFGIHHILVLIIIFCVEIFCFDSWQTWRGWWLDRFDVF